MGSTSFLVLLASSIYFISIDVSIHACNAYVSIAISADCDCVLQYNPSFFYKIQNDAWSSMRAVSRSEKKNQELWEIRSGLIFGSSSLSCCQH